jgi:hypothetical protein
LDFFETRPKPAVKPAPGTSVTSGRRKSADLDIDHDLDYRAVECNSARSIRFVRTPNSWMAWARSAESTPNVQARSTAATSSCNELFDSVKYFRRIPSPSLGNPSANCKKQLTDARCA